MNTSHFESTTALAFSEFEPGDGQRWSTWPATQPSERGPEPRPSWLVTSAAAVDTELGILKTGKEADVTSSSVPFRTPPGAGAHVLAAKRYRDGEHRDFHRSAQYQEGRTVRRTRDQRAIERGSSYGRGSRRRSGRSPSSTRSAGCRLGAPVPYPGADQRHRAAARVHRRPAAWRRPGCAVPRRPAGAAGAARPGGRLPPARARAGFAHGDLSPYNLLVHEGGWW